MAYGVSNVVWGSTVVYPSDSLAFCFYFLLFLMCHYAVMLSPRGQIGQKAKSLSSVSASKRLFPISDPSEPSLYLYRFLEMGPRHITYKLYKGVQSTYKVLRDKDDTSQSSYSMVVASVHRGLAVLRCLYAFLSRSTRRNRAPFHDDMRDLIDFHIFVQSSWLLTFFFATH